MQSYPLFCGAAWRKGFMGHTGFWFRVYGYGLHVCTRKRSDAFFSERNGMRQAYYLAGVRFEVLTR